MYNNYGLSDDMKKKKEIRLDNYFRFKNSDTIVVGCSGGPDSMALMDMLLKIREKYSLKIICAHVNHNVRKDSVIEEEYVRSYAKSNHLIFEGMIIEKYGDDNFENEARNIRYNFFESLIRKYHAEYLMTAHHGDDLIETILMRIVRGSNLSGYSGFKEIVDMDFYKLVRPLIHFTKEELIEYNKNNHVKYFIDASNFNTLYTRNRYRKDILPFLKKEDKNVHQKFLKFNHTLQEVNKFVSKERDKALKNILDHGKMDISKCLELDSFLQREILYYLMSEFYQDDLILIHDKHIDLVYNIITSRKSNISANLPNEVEAVKSYNYFFLRREMEELTKYEIELDDKVVLPNGHSIRTIKESEDTSNFTCRLSSSDISLPLIVRTRKMGDKIALKGCTGSRKIKDIFIDSKVDIYDRDMWPIVEDSLGRVVWIPGLKKSKFDKKKNEFYDIILKYR